MTTFLKEKIISALIAGEEEVLENFFDNMGLNPYCGESKLITKKIKSMFDITSIRHYDTEGCKFTSVNFVIDYGDNFETINYTHCWG